MVGSSPRFGSGSPDEAAEMTQVAEHEWVYRGKVVPGLYDLKVRQGGVVVRVRFGSNA